MDCALLYHSKLVSSPARDSAAVVLEALVAATAKDGVRSLPFHALRSLGTQPATQATDTPSRKLFHAVSVGHCTLSVTGESAAMQFYFSCKTCKFAPGTCACAACAVECHAGHELGPAQYDMAYCDCPAELKARCVVPKSQL